MEVFAAVSSVAGIISLVVQITALSCQYVSSLQRSTKTIKSYFHELESLKYVLRQFEELLTNPRTAHHACVAVYPEVLDNFRQELKRLHLKLQKRNSEGTFTNSMRRLSWPIVEDETRHLVEMLSRYRGNIVALLGPDHFNLSVRINEAVEKIQTSIDTMQHQNITAWLDPLDQNYGQVIARERHEHNTGNWILDFGPFQMWQQGIVKHLWITGRPGTGKTILCSTIIDHLQLSESKTETTAYFYFDFSDHARQSVQAALRSLMSQMALRLEKSAKKVESIYRDAGAGLNNRVPTTKCLLGALKKIAKRFVRVNIVLDGIDESTERAILLDILAEIASELTDVVRFLIASRPQRDVPEALGNKDVMAISLDNNPFVQTDIARYVRSILDRDSRLKTRPPNVKRAIEEALIGKAGGIFRWTECQLDALRHCPTLLSIEQTLASLPQSLEKTYERTLSTIRPEYQQYVKRALYLLCFSYKPLSQPLFVNEVAEFAVIDTAGDKFSQSQQFFDPEEILEYCSGLIYVVPISNDVRLAHCSVKEYLLSAQIITSPAAPFAMTKQEAQNALAEGCLMYLMNFDKLSVRLADCSKDFPFLSYAIHNWHKHVRRGKNIDNIRLDGRILQFLDCESSRAFSNWLASFQPALLLDDDYARSEHSFSPLYTMAYFKCYDVIPLLLNRLHHHGLGCGPALGLATRVDIQLLEILVQHGCDMQCQLDNGESIPAYAARCASTDVLRMLLDAGIETAATTGNPSMLMIAIIYRRADVVELLLEEDADVFEMDNAFGSVLHAAVAHQCTGRGFYANLPNLRIIELLLDWGASPDAWTEKHGSVMHTAIATLPGDIVVSQLSNILYLLIAAGANANIIGGQFCCALQALMALCIPNKHKQMLFDLLLSAGAQLDLKGGFYGTTLQAAAASNASRALVQSILNSTDDIDELSGFFGTALQAASYAGNIPVLVLLLDAGADVNLRGGQWGSPLQAACHTDHSGGLELVRILLDHGAKVNVPPANGRTDPGGTPLQIAASRGNHNLVQLLLEEGADVNAQGALLGPALHACLLGSHFGVPAAEIRTIALLLLEAGADKNQRGGGYGAAIIAAAASGDEDIIKMLLDARVNVNVIAEGSLATPLHVAAQQSGTSKAVGLLLKSGAQVGDKDATGRTAIDIACLKGNIGALNVLISGNATTDALVAPSIALVLPTSSKTEDEMFQEFFARYAGLDEEVNILYQAFVSNTATEEQLEEIQAWRDVLIRDMASPESMMDTSTELLTDQMESTSSQRIDDQQADSVMLDITTLEQESEARESLGTASFLQNHAIAT